MGSFPWIFDHIEINPLSIVVFISAFGGYDLLIRLSASKQIKQIDAEDPLPPKQLCRRIRLIRVIMTVNPVIYSTKQRYAHNGCTLERTDDGQFQGL